MTKAKHKIYIFYLMIAILAFSSFEVSSKLIGSQINPTQLTFFRFLIGGLILLPFTIRNIRKNKIAFTKKDFFILLLLGFMLVFVSMNMAQYGIVYTAASVSAVIFSSNAIFVSLFSAILLKEALTWKKVLGLLIGAAGLVITFGNIFSGQEISPTYILGIVLVVTSMLVFSLYTVLSKKTAKKIGSLTVTSLSSILGSLTLLPLMAATGVNPFDFDLLSILPQFLYICIFVTGIAYYCYFEAIAHLDTSLGSMTFFIKPPLASILAAAFLGEVITSNIIIGIVLILIGMFIVMKSLGRSAAPGLEKGAAMRIPDKDV